MEYMDAAHKAGIVPVISPLAAELATGRPLNINADLAAAAPRQANSAWRNSFIFPTCPACFPTPRIRPL